MNEALRTAPVHDRDRTNGALIDDYGVNKAIAADAKDRMAEIKAELIRRGFDAGESMTLRATLTHTVRTVIDWKAIAAKFNPSRQMITAHSKKQDVSTLRVVARKGG